LITTKRRRPVELIEQRSRTSADCEKRVRRATLKVEFVHRHRFHTRAEARLKIVTWITGFYNLTRRHSLCGGLSPTDYETHMAAVRAAHTTAPSRDEAA
jgi:transposase InsO family protein